MSNRTATALSAWKKLLLLTAGLAILIGPILAGGVNARPLHPQGQSAGDETLEFDVASIKPNNSGAGRVSMRFLPGGSYEATNVTLRAMIQQAYRMAERQVIGGPGWLETDRFDILATSPQGAVQGQFPDRLQALLIDRLDLKTHRETRDMPIYALVLARTGDLPGGGGTATGMVVTMAAWVRRSGSRLSIAARHAAGPASRRRRWPEQAAGSRCRCPRCRHSGPSRGPAGS